MQPTRQTPPRKRICIIAFSPILRDARVLREIDYLAPRYDLTVIGYGDPDPAWQHVTWCPVPSWTPLSKLIAVLLLALGRLWPRLYDFWYWRGARHRKAYEYALASQPDAIHANDWSALPIAVEVAKRQRCKVVFDAHEYAPLEREEDRLWRLTAAPMVTSMLRRYVPYADASMTVAQPIADRYRREFGIDPMVVLNAPSRPAINPPNPHKDGEGVNILLKSLPLYGGGGFTAPTATIRLIHHGSAQANRRLETMIEALALLDQRFSLHFMLVGKPSYIAHLKQLTEKIAPGRVTFHDPVPPAQIVERIAAFDIGFCLIEPANYNYLMALPNKFFDFIMAGLAVCTGPSPAMAELVQQYAFGCVTPSFDPADVAHTLQALTSEQIAAMKTAAIQATQHFNADEEMGKVVALYGKLLNRQPAVASSS